MKLSLTERKKILGAESQEFDFSNYTKFESFSRCPTEEADQAVGFEIKIPRSGKGLKHNQTIGIKGGRDKILRSQLQYSPI